MPLLLSHFSVDKECQHDADDPGNGEADGQPKLQCQYPKIQNKRGGQTKTAAIIQPAQCGNATQSTADKPAQNDAGQHQQDQYPYIL